METFRIGIINSKPKSLIQYLAKMVLFRINNKKAKLEFVELFNKLRKHFENLRSLEEITKEMELVRSARFAK